MNVIERLVQNIDHEEIEKIEQWKENNEGTIFATLVAEFYATEKILEKFIEELVQSGYLDVQKHFEELKRKGREIADKRLSEKKTNAQILLIALVKNCAIVWALSKKLLKVLLLKSASSLKPGKSA